MTVLRENPNKTKFYVPALLVCKFTPDPELALKSKLYKGLPVGKVTGALKEIALQEATTFVGHMKNQGNILQGHITEMELWGPYRNRPTGNRTVNIEAGNHLIPEGKWAYDSKGVWRPQKKGPQVLDRETVLDDPDWRFGVCYLIRGSFLATKGHQEETTGVVIL